MNRRQFLASLFVGAPVTAVAHKLGWWAQLKEWWAKPASQMVHADPRRIDELTLEHWRPMPEFLRGLPYHQTNANAGTFHGLKRSPGKIISRS